MSVEPPFLKDNLVLCLPSFQLPPGFQAHDAGFVFLFLSLFLSFFFFPFGGWRRGICYNNLEKSILSNCMPCCFITIIILRFYIKVPWILN